jgi:hypothetical protein
VSDVLRGHREDERAGIANSRPRGINNAPLAGLATRTLHMRGMEDAALVRGGFDFDIEPVLFKGRVFPNLCRRRKAWKRGARPDLHRDGDAAGRRDGRSHHAGDTPAVMLGHDRPRMSSSRQSDNGDLSCAVQLKSVALCEDLC